MDNYEEVNDLIEFLKETSRDMAYNIAYDILVKSREVAFEESVPSDERLSSLNMLIKHFTEKEEYEKCAYLQKIVKEITNNDNEKSLKEI